MVDAFYRKKMNVNARENRASSYLALDQYSLIKAESTLQGTNLTNVTGRKAHYAEFRAKPLCLFQLRFSKYVKERTWSICSLHKK